MWSNGETGTGEKAGIRRETDVSGKTGAARETDMSGEPGLCREMGTGGEMQADRENALALQGSSQPPASETPVDLLNAVLEEVFL